MSGIVGILQLNKTPVNPFQLQELTNFLSFRGPDRQNSWVDGNVGFGHTLLATTREAYFENQPFTLDGQTWLVADARIDGREALLEELNLEKYSPEIPVTDIELILRAYLKWGENCVKHLLGDFAFAIWDSAEQNLFCARDHYGAKPFFYARQENLFLFSNTLNCIRQHPAISEKLNEQALGDYLLFSANYNLSTTVFEAVKRLPPAHYLLVQEGEIKVKQYWSLPVPEITRYRRRQEYVDHFLEIIDLAVADRLRNDKVAVLFSGGMDSNTIAATALEAAAKRGQKLDLQGFTRVYDHLVPDKERYYAGKAAKALGIPLHFHPVDDYYLFQGWDRPEMLPPEPGNLPYLKIGFDFDRKVSQHSRVALFGLGGDETLKHASVFELFTKQSFSRGLADLLNYIWLYHRRPTFGLQFKHRLRKLVKPKPETEGLSPIPDWLKKEFVKRLDLETRWNEVMGRKPKAVPSVRSSAYEMLSSPIWTLALEELDPGFWAIPLEVRLPFLDLRLVQFLLSLPPLPWCEGKELLRSAMRGKIAEEIRLRPKTALAGDVLLEGLKRGENPIRNLPDFPELEQYVEIGKVLAAFQKEPFNKGSAWEALRVQSLGYWLRRSSRTIKVT